MSKKMKWAVVWANDGGVGATPNSILVVEVFDSISQRYMRDKKGIVINSCAIFNRRKDAVTFRGGDSDWKIIKVKVCEVKE